jgi:hypothetical protein
VADEDEPDSVNPLEGDMVSQGLTEVTRTPGKLSRKF